jgi:hypothetical protein
MACNGNCSACSGCGKALELTQGELDLLNTLAQIPFLPVARKADDMTPLYLEDTAYSQEEYSLILQVLEKKGLIDLDYGSPLKGFDMAAYQGYPVHGTMALTGKGQTVVELLDKQGIS